MKIGNRDWQGGGTNKKTRGNDPIIPYAVSQIWKWPFGQNGPYDRPWRPLL